MSASFYSNKSDTFSSYYSLPRYDGKKITLQITANNRYIYDFLLVNNFLFGERKKYDRKRRPDFVYLVELNDVPLYTVSLSAQAGEFIPWLSSLKLYIDKGNLYLLSGKGSVFSGNFSAKRITARIYKKEIEALRYSALFFPLFFQLVNFTYLHASCVVTDNSEGLLIAGKSGCGKTTLANRIIKSSPQYRLLSDDWLYLHFLQNYSAIFASRLSCSDSIKGKKEIKDIRAGRIWDKYAFSCLPRRIVFPYRTNKRGWKLVPLSAHEVMRELWKSTALLFQSKERAEAICRAFKRLSHQCKGYILINGRDLINSENAINDLFDRIWNCKK